MTIESKQTQKGFTLIELMIVVAIIGILASIAIPQFSTFRIKAFNSAAIADLHSVSLAEEALYTDYQEYGSTQLTATVVGAAAGSVLVGEKALVAAPAASVKPAVVGVTSTANTPAQMPITISTKVSLIANAEATGLSATMIAKHTAGDKGYGQETDQSGLYFIKSLESGVIAAGNVAAAAAAANGDITGVVATTALDLTAGAGLWSIK